MKPIACKAHVRSGWLALWMVCGMALTSTAHAQFGGWGGWGGNAGAQQQVGTTLAVPMYDLGSVMAYNIINQNNVSFLAIANTGWGNGNVQLALVGITQRNTGGPAKKVWLPKKSLGQVQQINNNTVIVENKAYGNGNLQVAQVDVTQKNYASVPKGTRYFMCPAWAAGPILQMNNNVVIVYNFALGNGNTQVAMVGVTQENSAKGVKVPKDSASDVVQINNNVTVVANVAVGDGNVQAAVVNVDQNNRG